MGFNLPWFNTVIGKSLTRAYTKSPQRMLNVLNQAALVLEREHEASCTTPERSMPTAPGRAGPRWSRVARGTAASSKNWP